MAEGDTPQLPTPEDMTNSTEAANNAAVAFTGMESSVEGARKELLELDVVANGVSDVFQGFTNVIKDFTGAQDFNVAMTDEQITKLGLLTTAAFGSRKAFDALAGIKTDGLSTFGQKLDYITNDILKSGGGIAGLANLAKNVLGKTMPEEFKTSVDAAKGFIMSLVEGADNALRLQNAVVQLAGQTGGLNSLYNKAGANLQSVNAILDAHNTIIANTVKETGANEKAVEDYWAALGSIPKALEQTIQTGRNADTTTSMLTATMRAATATGRDTKDVITDMHNAFREYGIVGEDALKFTLRMSEVSSNFGIEFKDVQAALSTAAQDMGHFARSGKDAANMSESLAQSMQHMVGGLMDAGMTAKDAVQAFTQVEKSIQGLDIAKKSFLSAQTGGPGGLMGGFQIEKLLREGKFDEVAKKQMDTIKKLMGGKIVTLDEASTSQSAAAQMQKQVQLLQQGPLGSMIKNPQDAYKMFDMFRGSRAGALTELGKSDLKKDPVRDAVEMGSKWEEKTYGQLDIIRGDIGALRRIAETSNLEMIQGIGTASADTEAGDALKARRQDYAQQGGFEAGQYGKEMRGRGMYVDRRGEHARQATTDMAVDVKNLGDWFRKLPETLQSSLKGMQQSFAKNDIQAANAQLKSVEDEVKTMRANAKKMTGPERDKLLQDAQKKQDAATALYMSQSQRVKQVEGSPALLGIKAGDFGEDVRRQIAAPGNRVTPGANVGGAARPTARPGTPGQAGTGNVPTDVHVQQQGGSNRIKVNVVVTATEVNGQPNSTHTPGTP